MTFFLTVVLLLHTAMVDFKSNNRHVWLISGGLAKVAHQLIVNYSHSICREMGVWLYVDSMQISGCKYEPVDSLTYT